MRRNAPCLPNAIASPRPTLSVAPMMTALHSLRSDIVGVTKEGLFALQSDDIVTGDRAAYVTFVAPVAELATDARRTHRTPFEVEHRMSM